MTSHRLLAGISAAQLAGGLAGLGLAVARRRPFDLPGWRGSPDLVARDALWMGTAMSAPGPMLVAQAVSTVIAARRPSDAAARTIGNLGLAMLGGYGIERHIRHRLTPGGWDRLETPLLAGGWALAAGMAYLGRPRR